MHGPERREHDFRDLLDDVFARPVALVVLANMENPRLQNIVLSFYDVQAAVTGAQKVRHHDGSSFPFLCRSGLMLLHHPFPPSSLA